MTGELLHTSDVSVPHSFPLGVNYWPARTAMGFWSQFERSELVRDFVRITEAGFDSVRIFLTWEDFQPHPGSVDVGCVRHLVDTLNVAQTCALRVMPTLFTGHMSGVNWIPPWALGASGGDKRFRVISAGKTVAPRLANWYFDPAITAAQQLLAGELAKATAGHPALWAWDLGNENSNCTLPPDRSSARDWLRRITCAIRNADSNAKITIGLHMEDLEEDRKLGPKEAAEFCDFLTMHGYPAYAAFTDGPMDERLLPFLTRLTACLSNDAPVLFSEFGIPTDLEDSRSRHPGSSASALVSETEAASYIGRALRALHEGGSQGAMLWCYTDYAKTLHETPPFDRAVHERSFGQFRADGSPKPAIPSLQSFREELLTLPRPSPIPHSHWFDLDPDEFYSSPKTQIARLYRRYCSAIPTAV